MKLTPELKFIQEKLVLVAHPGLSFCDSLQIDSKNRICLGICNDQVGSTIHKYELIDRPEDTRFLKIIGLPPTLSRVLNGLGKYYIYSYYGMIAYVDMYTNSEGSSPIGEDGLCDRKLLNDDGSDATLFDQSPETITTIAREMGYKSE